MIFREDVFNDLQNDLSCPLLADEYFSDISVFDYRKEEIANLIEMSLGIATAKSSKIGVCVIVMPLAIMDDYREATSSHLRRCRVTYLVLENPLFNNGDNGTKKSALSVCSRIGHVMKHYVLGGFASGLVPADGAYIVPEENEAGVIAYNVLFDTFEMVDQILPKCQMPGHDFDDVTGILTLTSPTPDATIYYTLDGGYPHPSNPNGFTVTQYTGPITISGEVLVRAACFKEAHIPSNVWAARFDEISIGDGLGGILGTETGEPITLS